MKKWQIMLNGILLFLLILGADLSATETEATKLYLDIVFKENMIFDKYDVDLFVDNKQVDTLKYGEPFSKLIDVSGDSHTITYYKASDHDCSGQEEIRIAGDSTYRAIIQTDSKKIKIVSSEVEETLEGSSLEVADVSLTFLPEALEKLKELGFKKVTYSGTGGGNIKKDSNWIVLSQRPSPGSLIDQNDEIVLSCSKITDFVSETFMGGSVKKAIEEATRVQYEVSFINALTGRDMRNEFAEIGEGELVKWKVTNAVPIESNKKVATLYVKYKGRVTVPDVTGMSLENAITEMHFSGISAVQGQSDTGKKIKESNGAEWKVISQSETAGKKMETDREIILSCESYKELSEISIFSTTHREENEKAEREQETERETVLVTEMASKIITEEATGPETEKESENETETKKEINREVETEIKAKTTYTTIADLNVRSLPSTEGTVLGKLNAYEQVSVYEIDNGWALIDYGGTDAYVSAKYIQEGTILPLTTPETNASTVSSSTSRAVPQTEQQNQYQEPMVWISGSGSKYHSRPSCSNMNSPWQVPMSEAEAMGKTPCKKCY